MTGSKTPLNLKPRPVATQKTGSNQNWRVLVVDDEEAVHAVTNMVLSKIRYKNRGIEIISAYSGTEAEEILLREKDIAIILLDVVMETDDAGLKLVRTIREDLKNDAVRIILRTGQPGQTPEEHIIINYDINDYKSKNELTAQKLFTTIIAGLRSYATMISLEKNRRGLEKILDSSSSLFQGQSIRKFASGILIQLSTFLECQTSGILCIEYDSGSSPGGPASYNDMSVFAATGEYSDCATCRMDESCKHPQMIALVKKALEEQKHQISDEYTVLFLDAGDAKGAAALLHGGLSTISESDRQLLEVFTSKISIALSNAFNYQKLISAEEAATTDFLTGLNNRRQLIRLSVPLVSGAYRSGTPLAVAMIDIDHFKRINDTYGHDAGDEVLKRIGTLLKERFRSSDIVSRFGGEEFCVIAVNLTPNAAFELFDNFRKSLETEVFDLAGEKAKITTSIGVCTEVSDSVDTMIKTADQLLYQAKKGGRNRVMLS